MARKLILCLALCLVTTAPLTAAGHSACTDTGYDWFRHTASELRQIAADCKSRRFSELNFHRAYFRDLLNESAGTASLIYYARSDSKANVDAYMFHMLLIEQLTPYYFDTTEQRLTYLNKEYEINSDIAELWLRGYNNLAMRLSELHLRKD